MTEQHVLLASGESFAATRWLDVRRPGVPELVEVVRVDGEGRATKLEAGSLWEADRYEWDGTVLRWALRPGNAAPWEAPTTLLYRLKWKAHGALTPVWGPRPAARPMPGSPLGERLAARWRETREAFARLGKRPLHRYVLDLNVAAPSREGPIEALDYGLSGDDAWAFGGSFTSVTLDRALPPDEGIDLSFLFDRKAGDRPAGVGLLGLAALLGLSLLPMLAGLLLLVRTFLAWRKARPREPEPAALPDRVEALSPELFGSLFGDAAPRPPTAGAVWARLRNGKAVGLDRQEPPNLVLRADPSDLRPPEAVLVGLLFGERSAMPLPEARAAAMRSGRTLDEAVGVAFDGEVRNRVGERSRPEATRRVLLPVDPDLLSSFFWVLVLVVLALDGASLGERAAGAAAALAVAVSLWLGTRKARDAGLGALSALLPAGASVVFSALLLVASYLLLEPSTQVHAVLLAATAVAVVRGGFVGARPCAAAPSSPLKTWALEQREALRERLVRSGGEVEPAEAPWFRAAGLEVSLAEPGVPEEEMEELLGDVSALSPPGEPKG